MEKRASTLDSVKGLIIPDSKDPSDKELVEFIAGAHFFIARDEAEISLKNPAMPNGYPKDFGYIAEQEYYEEPWIVDLRSAIARYFFCLYTKTNRTVKGRRAGNPHKVCINVTVGRKQNTAAAKIVSDSVIEAVKRRAHSYARSALESARAAGKDIDTRTFTHAAKRDAGNKIVAKVNDMADDVMLHNQDLQPYYAFDLRYADKYLSNELGGRQTLSHKKLKIAA